MARTEEPTKEGQGEVGPPSSGPGTPEGHTPEKPAPDEYGKLGTPAAGLSPAVPHASDAEHGSTLAPGGTVITGEADAHAMDAHHVGGGHDEEHTGGHDHADEHEEAALGAIDWGAWAYSALGLAIAAVIAGLFFIATLPK